MAGEGLPPPDLLIVLEGPTAPTPQSYPRRPDPIRKSPAWRAPAQDERRAILEAQSHHIALGLPHLPAVARRLHHGRDLAEPFDFLSWFEYAHAHAEVFETLVADLRHPRNGATWSRRWT